MEIGDYEILTGVKVSQARRGVVSAQLARTQTILETMLGFTLDPDLVTENLYTELGKSPVESLWTCSSVDTVNLLPADPVVGAYRIYRYNPKDVKLHVDPFTEVHAIKLVRNGVTLYTFDEDDYTVQYSRGWSKYIAVHLDSILGFARRWECVCGRCSVQLAVDADWLWEDEVPQELQFVWADITTYYADPKLGIKSESIGSHTITRFDNTQNRSQMIPEEQDANLNVLKRYAGPLGSVVRTHTV